MTIKDSDISVERTITGYLVLSTITDDGEYYKHRYEGYSIKEAKTMFREYVREEQSKIFKNIS